MLKREDDGRRAIGVDPDNEYRVNGIKPKILVERLAYRCPDEAAAVLGVSPDFFDAHVRHELKVVRRGRLVFVSRTELERWLRDNACRAIA